MRVLAAVGLLLAGTATGLATVALHQAWWGLLLAAVAVASTLVALPPGWWSRAAFGLGFAGLAGYLSLPRPEGDYLISSDPQGYLLLGLALVVMVVSLATLPRPVRGDARRGPSAS